MDSITIILTEDNGKEIHFSDSEMKIEAERLVTKYLGNDVYFEDFAGLSQDLSITKNDFEHVLALYTTSRKRWIEIMHDRAFTFWRETILENLSKQGE